jgi:ABC-2 type transport system permease protein
MGGTWIIFRREVAQYFNSPFAYFIAAAFLMLTSFLFVNDLTVSIGTKPVQPALVPGFLSFALVFIAPLLTMRSLAEEGREGTMELLLTAPVKDSDVVFGKFLSAWFYYTLLLLLSLVYQVILLVLDTRPDMSHTVSAYIGIWLYGGATLAVGLLFSSLTENQVVSAFLATAVLLILWLGDLAGQIVANIDLARVIRQLTLQGHFSTSFAVGLIRAEDVAYYAGIIVIMVFMTIRVVESRRWR